MKQNDLTDTIDADMDGVVEAQEVEQDADAYAENLATQLRKGFLAYCVMLICNQQPKYTSDIIRELHEADLVVVEGTIYPLLNRLQKDGILKHEWQESEQGPPRKYYSLTDFGGRVQKYLATSTKELNKTLQRLEKGA